MGCGCGGAAVGGAVVVATAVGGVTREFTAAQGGATAARAWVAANGGGTVRTK